MSVYVEECRIPWKGKLWAHMGADTIEELHEVADKIGLKREWFQDTKHPHYDIVESKRQLALENGAIAVRSILRR